MEKVKEKVKVQFTEAMRIDGIYGSAVEPKFEGNEIWKKENERLDHFYKMNLEEIRQQLRAL
jgi:hypothetical protein